MAVSVDAWDGAAARGTANIVGSHTTAAEELAAAGRWEAAYQHLRAAVRLLHGQQPADELDRLRRENAEAREQSRRDSLTASYNRRYLDERLATLLADPASRGTDGIAIALVDADHFKQVNDTYGHQFGDRVLQRHRHRARPRAARRRVLRPLRRRGVRAGAARAGPGRGAAGLRGAPANASTATRGPSWPPACASRSVSGWRTAPTRWPRSSGWSGRPTRCSTRPSTPAATPSPTGTNRPAWSGWREPRAGAAT